MEFVVTGNFGSLIVRIFAEFCVFELAFDKIRILVTLPRYLANCIYAKVVDFLKVLSIDLQMVLVDQIIWTGKNSRLI